MKTPLTDRRTFIRQCACAALGTTSLASTIWNLRSVRAATANNPFLNSSGDFKALVCIFLYGGNDANNLIVPIDTTDYDAYAAARQGLAIPQASLLPISPLTYSDGRSFGLHPSFVDAPAGAGIATATDSGCPAHRHSRERRYRLRDVRVER